MIKVLMVDKDKFFMGNVQLPEHLYSVKRTDCLEKWSGLLEKEVFDVILLSYKDIECSDTDIKSIAEKYPETDILMVGERGEISLKEAIDLGAVWLLHPSINSEDLNKIILNLRFRPFKSI